MQQSQSFDDDDGDDEELLQNVVTCRDIQLQQMKRRETERYTRAVSYLAMFL